MVDILTISVAIIAIIASTYYFLVLKPKAELEKIKQQQLEKEERRKREEAEEERKKQAKNNKKKSFVPKKKIKKITDKAHDPSNHPRYIRRFGGHHGDIIAIAVSPNGEWIATSGADGQLRVAYVEKGCDPNMFVQTTVSDHDKISSMSWEGDNRTIACVLERTDEITFYRVRKKKIEAGDTSSHFPYELIELVKRRFSTDSKFNKITAIVADQASTTFNLVLTSGEPKAKLQTTTAAGWDGKNGHFLCMLSTSGDGNVRISKSDGRFICSRSSSSLSANEIKIFEVVKKRHKGQVDPEFDNIPTKSAMTLPIGKQVVDVDYLYNHNNIDHIVTDKAIVCCEDGIIQIWNLDVEYRLQEDPKLIVETSLTSLQQKQQASNNEEEPPNVIAIATSLRLNRIAIAVTGSIIHICTFNEDDNTLSYDFSIENCHGIKGIEDIQFSSCGTVLYSKGTMSKDVFSWQV